MSDILLNTLQERTQPAQPTPPPPPQPDLGKTPAAPAPAFRYDAFIRESVIVSLDLGRKPTGWAFVIFVTSSIALIGWGFLNDEGKGIGVQNMILLAINLIGVYRYLIRKKPVHGEAKA